ncbi:hypothetical protein SAMN05421770_11186 [Granulicella rosea]|uniref:4-amino-4-deoxy-L-arabinose transferase n=1 Tax=Granulicella rosea TaxID=474952 RepID=A0A239MD06_9BACT|nr:hypothetical protein [Granulicella rosea]SNT40370.1 hypothetical protein SAMN05421770_11186 [Granulicella rosea]
MRSESLAVRLTPVALFVASAVALFARFRRDTFLAFYDDDLFYYLKIAQNLTHGQGSTFDGIHLTNGYHPLWMLTLTALTAIVPHAAFFYALQCLLLASVMATFFAARGLLLNFNAGQTISNTYAVVLALQTMLLIRGGMEVTLTIPLALALCRYRLQPSFRWTAGAGVRLGLFAGLVILSRLDSALLVALLFAFDLLLARPATRDDWAGRLAAAAACGTPVALYLASNVAFFHTLMPLSGQAKQMRLHGGFNRAAIDSLLHYLPGALRGAIVLPAMLAILCALALLALRATRGLNNAQLAIALSLIAFPFLHILTLSYLSDWPLWGWYLYSVVLAMAGALALLTKMGWQATRWMPAAALALMALVTVAECRRTQAGNLCYSYGRDLEGFARTHDGVYAMGDAAGTAGYLMQPPLVQLEGLVMNKPYLALIRNQANLRDVLKSYGVRYYVTPDSKQIGNCAHATEPKQAGANAPHMQGDFCMSPVATFQHGAVTLVVFDLRTKDTRTTRLAEAPTLGATAETSLNAR